MLDFRVPIMGALKSPCRLSIETIALNCSVFEKIAFFAFCQQTDRQTDGLSRSSCRDRQLSNVF